MALQADSLNGEYVTFMYALQAQLTNASLAVNTTAGGALYSSLVSNYLSNPSGVSNSWTMQGYQSFLFSFELLTTIGYGEIAPKTIAGRLWLCLFSLLTIPLAGVCLSTIALFGLELLETGLVGSSTKVRAHWRSIRDGRGIATLVAVRGVLDGLEGQVMSDDEFEAHCDEARVDMHSTIGVSYWQFVRLYTSAGNPAMQVHRKWRRLSVSGLLVVCWLVLGTLVFQNLEAWGYHAAFYFCFVTLSTIGLGDYYPSTSSGEDFHFFYCVTGLGLVAVLLNSIADVASMDTPTDEQQDADALKQLKSPQQRKMEMILVSDPASGPAQSLTQPQQPPPQQQQVQAASTRALVQRLAPAEKQAAVRQLLQDCRREPWLLPLLDSYVPRPAGGDVAGAPVIKVFAAEGPPRRGADGGAGVPGFKPSYTQLYEDEPYNLSGAPRPGFPLYDDTQFRRELAGRAATGSYDRASREYSHGPYPPDDGLTGAVLGSLAAPQQGTRDGGWARGELGDDGLPWDHPRGKAGGVRDKATGRYREERATNRL